MGLTSLQVCMDSDWLQGTIHEENGMDSSSPSGGDILTCSRPLIERRLRPPHDTALKCPRCDSTHTKFCYYNNYSLSQPRYFCKTCRRYWTKGGTLRNIPVGGGCRKNKKVSRTSSKKSNDNNNINNHHCNIVTQNVPAGSSSNIINPTDLQLSFPEMQFSQFSNLFGAHGGLANPDFMETKYSAAMFDQNPRAIDFMESAAKYEGHFLGINGTSTGDHHELGMMGGLGHDHMGGTHGLIAPNFHGNFCSTSTAFGMSLDGQNNAFIDTTCQRALLPYEGNHKDQNNAVEVKPNTKLLSLEWQDHGCSDIAGKDSFGYISGLGSWTGLMNGYGPSATNSLV